MKFVMERTLGPAEPTEGKKSVFSFLQQTLKRKGQGERVFPPPAYSIQAEVTCFSRIASSSRDVVHIHGRVCRTVRLGNQVQRIILVT